MKAKENACINCGKSVGSERKLYCSQRCRDRYFYTTTKEEREHKRQLLGLNYVQEYISDPKRSICINCGEAIQYKSGERRRLYCDRHCEDQYNYKTPKEERERNRQLIKSSNYSVTV